MDLKKVLLEMAEAQANKMQTEAVGWIASDEFSENLAQLLNDKINIPFVSEEKEGDMFKELVEVFQDLAAGLFKGK